MGFFQRAYDWLAGFGRYLKKVILDIFTDSIKTFIEKMGPTIEGILKDIQADPAIVTSEDKRKAAYDQIKEAAKTAGMETVKDSVIFMAIELLINALKNTGKLGDNAGE